VSHEPPAWNDCPKCGSHIRGERHACYPMHETINTTARDGVASAHARLDRYQKRLEALESAKPAVMNEPCVSQIRTLLSQRDLARSERAEAMAALESVQRGVDHLRMCFKRTQGAFTDHGGSVAVPDEPMDVEHAVVQLAMARNAAENRAAPMERVVEAARSSVTTDSKTLVKAIVALCDALAELDAKTNKETK